MPNVNIYLPDNMYKRFIDEQNKSKLIQRLLNEYWKKKQR